MAAPGRVAALPSAPFSGFVRHHVGQTLSGPSAQQQQGHGPYRWYPCADRKNAELWFWYLPPQAHRESKSLGGIGVSYVTLVPADNPDKQQFVGPDRYTSRRERLSSELYEGAK